MRKLVVLFGIFALALAFTAAPAWGTVIGIYSESDLGPGVTTFDWSLLEASGINITDGTTLSVGGIDVSVSNPSGTLQRQDQGNVWGGDFLPGTPLLWTNFSPGPLEINFSTPVSGFGVNIQSGLNGLFTATVRVFDALDNLLGQFSITDTSDGTAAGTAPFLGVLSTSNDITKALYFISDPPTGCNFNGDFAIGPLQCQTSTVPLPSSLILMGTGILWLYGEIRRRKT